MAEKIFVVILVFVLLFVAFNPTYLSSESELPTFSRIFVFGYELTVGSVEVLISVFKGPGALADRFAAWRVNVFGQVTVFDFIDNFTDRLPVVRTLKGFVEAVISPLQDVFAELSTWIRNRLD